jgi:hypothetical protein
MRKVTMGYKADAQAGGKIRTGQTGAPGRHTIRKKDKDRATRGTRQTHKQEER